jgi:predicted TIM-barrel fold metal-dependent hydrolase
MENNSVTRRNAPGIIDTDVHNTTRTNDELLEYLPEVWHQLYKASVQLFGLGNLYPSPIHGFRQDAVTEDGGTPASDPHYMIKHHLEAYGIDYAILTGAAPHVLALHPDLDFGNAVIRAHNDHLITRWLPVDSRFKGSICVNPSDPEKAVEEIERLAAHPGMVQILITSSSHTPYGQRFYHPIYEAAEHYGLPIAVHPGGEGKGTAYPSTPGGFPTRYMEWHNLWSLNTMGHINSLVCEGVFEKFPKLKFVFLESGVAWLPHLMWRMDKNYKALRSSTPWLRRLPSEYIIDHIRLSTQPIEEPGQTEELLQIFRMIDAEKTLMFSSDYPHWDFDNPKLALPLMPREMKERILYGTAAELYGLTAKPV